ncbi:hypothetical protein B0H14DRAFT_2627460 [Mycena olivaceomarginata]|nr:hypothetical protein B0H14DRAFT_2627460 [Mycena olivaceomarginata]
MDALRVLARTSLAVFMNLGRPRLNEVSYKGRPRDEGVGVHRPQTANESRAGGASLHGTGEAKLRTVKEVAQPAQENVVRRGRGTKPIATDRDICGCTGFGQGLVSGGEENKAELAYTGSWSTIHGPSQAAIKAGVIDERLLGATRTAEDRQSRQGRRERTQRGVTWRGESGGGQPSPESTHTTHTLAAVSVPKVAHEYQYKHTDSFRRAGEFPEPAHQHESDS